MSDDIYTIPADRGTLKPGDVVWFDRNRAVLAPPNPERADRPDGVVVRVLPTYGPLATAEPVEVRLIGGDET